MEKAKSEGKAALRRPNFAAALLLKKKIPAWLQAGLFYVCLCFGGWFMMRRSIAYFITANGIDGTAANVLGNEVVAFLLAGVIPLLIYEIGRSVALGMFRFPGAPPITSMNYALRSFYGLGYLVYGAFSMLYFAFPMLATYGDTIVRFLIVGGAIAWYISFEARFRLPPRYVPRAIYAFGGIYAILNLAFMIFSIMSLLMW